MKTFKVLSKESKHLLLNKIHKTLIILTKTSSFYICYHSLNILNITFYNKLENQISTLLFKNENKEELDIFLFNQLTRSK